MEQIGILARGKINLALDVLYKREDNYHELKTIMQSLTLGDRVFLEKTEKELALHCLAPYVPNNQKNIAYRAASLLKERYEVPYGAKIKIVKSIPVAAGLAGGSADGGAVLAGLNALWGLALKPEELKAIGKEIGADVPYCIYGGSALAEGIGEKLTSIQSRLKTYVLLIKPNVYVSTKEVYENLDLKAVKKRPHIENSIKAMEAGDTAGGVKEFVNVLETVTEKRHAVIGTIKEKMIENGALGALMSGSGPTVFGFYEDPDRAKFALRKLKQYGEAILTELDNKEYIPYL